MLNELIERLEKAGNGLDRNLWHDINSHAHASGWIGADTFTRNGAWIESAHRYSNERDLLLLVALTLVPEGWSWRVGENEPRNNSQVVLGRSYPTNKVITQEGHTPATTMSSAALKAHALAGEG